ncbi:hypothetical protein KFK09_000155 [Dendrobium nobile]|uniref:Uncharacterized protein n=1 Tax=Dendrobium nobile TaxID=94219 RepID=A0A8T3CDW8_DENNO|nr:hypothetical protein KFK09_000155 [Dendrobium nobile]
MWDFPFLFRSAVSIWSGRRLVVLFFSSFPYSLFRSGQVNVGFSFPSSILPFRSGQADR